MPELGSHLSRARTCSCLETEVSLLNVPRRKPEPALHRCFPAEVSFKLSPPQGTAGRLSADFLPQPETVIPVPWNALGGETPSSWENKAARCGTAQRAGREPGQEGRRGLPTLTWDLHLSPQADKGGSHRPLRASQSTKPPFPDGPAPAMPLIRRSPPPDTYTRGRPVPTQPAIQMGTKAGLTRHFSPIHLSEDLLTPGLTSSKPESQRQEHFREDLSSYNRDEHKNQKQTVER